MATLAVNVPLWNRKLRWTDINKEINIVRDKNYTCNYIHKSQQPLLSIFILQQLSFKLISLLVVPSNSTILAT